MKIAYDQTWNEPAPQKHYGMFCLDCKSKVASKARVKSDHRGHEVRYLNQDGSIRD